MIFNLQPTAIVKGVDVSQDTVTADKLLAGYTAYNSAGELITGTMGAEPIAYLYNGVQLPPLPEWDREAYPYAYILENGTIYCLALFPTSKKATSTKRITVFSDTLKYSVNESGNEWVASQTAGTMTLVWSNTDVYYSTDSSLCLSASDPVPVYE